MIRFFRSLFCRHKFRLYVLYRGVKTEECRECGRRLGPNA